jgi:hypothetical protein
MAAILHHSHIIDIYCRYLGAGRESQYIKQIVSSDGQQLYFVMTSKLNIQIQQTLAKLRHFLALYHRRLLQTELFVVALQADLNLYLQINRLPVTFEKLRTDSQAMNCYKQSNSSLCQADRISKLHQAFTLVSTRRVLQPSRVPHYRT